MSKKTYATFYRAVSFFRQYIMTVSDYSIHKKYGNSNLCVNFNTNISTFHNFIDTANWKYPFPSRYQISDTFVEYFGSYGH